MALHKKVCIPLTKKGIFCAEEIVKFGSDKAVAETARPKDWAMERQGSPDVVENQILNLLQYKFSKKSVPLEASVNATTWLVVTNRKVAKFFILETLQSLDLRKILSLEEFSEETKDFSDRPGRSHDRVGPGRHSITRKTTTSEKEKIVFARHVASFLSEAFNQGEFNRLYIASPPDFLGHLREALDKNISKTIEKEIAKDLVHEKPELVLNQIMEK